MTDNPLSGDSLLFKVWAWGQVHPLQGVVYFTCLLIASFAIETKVAEKRKQDRKSPATMIEPYQDQLERVRLMASRDDQMKSKTTIAPQNGKAHAGLPLQDYFCSVCDVKLCSGPPIFQWRDCRMVCEKCFQSILNRLDKLDSQTYPRGGYPLDV